MIGRYHVLLGPPRPYVEGGKLLVLGRPYHLGFIAPSVQLSKHNLHLPCCLYHLGAQVPQGSCRRNGLNVFSGELLLTKTIDLTNCKGELIYMFYGVDMFEQHNFAQGEGAPPLPETPPPKKKQQNKQANTSIAFKIEDVFLKGVPLGMKNFRDPKGSQHPI